MAVFGPGGWGSSTQCRPGSPSSMLAMSAFFVAVTSGCIKPAPEHVSPTAVGDGPSPPQSPSAVEVDQSPSMHDVTPGHGHRGRYRDRVSGTWQLPGDFGNGRIYEGTAPERDGPRGVFRVRAYREADRPGVEDDSEVWHWNPELQDDLRAGDIPEMSFLLVKDHPDEGPKVMFPRADSTAAWHEWRCSRLFAFEGPEMISTKVDDGRLVYDLQSDQYDDRGQVEHYFLMIEFDDRARSAAPRTTFFVKALRETPNAPDAGKFTEQSMWITDGTLELVPEAMPAIEVYRMAPEWTD